MMFSELVKLLIIKQIKCKILLKHWEPKQTTCLYRFSRLAKIKSWEALKSRKEEAGQLSLQGPFRMVNGPPHWSLKLRISVLYSPRLSSPCNYCALLCFFVSRMKGGMEKKCAENQMGDLGMQHKLKIGKIHLHSIWKSQEKYHSILRAKRAKFTFKVDKRSLIVPKIVNLASCEKLKVAVKQRYQTDQF